MQPNSDQPANWQQPSGPTQPSFQPTEVVPRPISQPRRLPDRRFWIPFLLQALLILSIPAQSAYTFVMGKTVVLQTVPVDPYDLLRGYFVVLSYDISQESQLSKLPGWTETLAALEGRQLIYVVLQAPATQVAQSRQQPPPTWQPVRVSATLPSNLPDNQVVLRGRRSPIGNVDYGLEAYYIPENQRDRINADISNANLGRPLNQAQPIVVEVKVDRRGYAVPVQFWVGDPTLQPTRYNRYQF